MDKVKVLGTTYKIKLARQEKLKEEYNPNADYLYGLCDYDKKLIMIDEDLGKAEYERTLRHEIVHAFFFESGLDTQSSYARNEELVDWLALQGTKMLKAFLESGAIQIDK